MRLGLLYVEVPMPTLTLVSLYNARKGMFAPDFARVRNELERFKEDLVARFGRETADAVRMQVKWTEDMIFGRVEVPKLTKEGYAAVERLQTLRVRGNRQPSRYGRRAYKMRTIRAYARREPA